MVLKLPNLKRIRDSSITCFCTLFSNIKQWYKTQSSLWEKVNLCAGKTLCLELAITRLLGQVKEHVCLSALYDMIPLTASDSVQVTGISQWVSLSLVSGDCGVQKLTKSIKSITKTAVVIMGNEDHLHRLGDTEQQVAVSLPCHVSVTVVGVLTTAGCHTGSQWSTPLSHGFKPILKGTERYLRLKLI